MRIVAALGGNALLRRGEPMTAAVQARNVRRAGAAIAPLIAAGHQVAITHGNGPQIGLLAERDARSNDGYPLDVLGAETDGMIGYLIERELAGALAPQHPIVGVLTQISVDRGDPAFGRPTKPIGPTYEREAARRLADAHGWTVAADGKGWRRVVPSPAPIDILEVRAIELLLDHDVTVICCGGGGIPVAATETGTLEGVEAVIDKDHASALLARLLGADMLLLLTDVAAVQTAWGTPDARAIPQLHAARLDPSAFPEGSMRPKVEAAMTFVNETGRRAAIGRLEDVAAIVAGEAGTQILP
ncbi:MAG: carbamate kinase [Bauldia sp.]|nr:carbamate kinase [Bauldia sp.]